jgi:hypothetical protein
MSRAQKHLETLWGMKMHISKRPSANLQLWITAALLAFALTGLGCGDDSSVVPVDSGSLPPSAGSGSGTLLAVVEIESRDIAGGGYETEFLATVTDTLGEPVSGRVVVSGRFGDVQLAEEVPGTYRAAHSGYATGSYTLNITDDAGSITGVTVLAPVIHTITTPTGGQTVEANTALNVRWSRAEPALQCRLDTRDYDSDWINGDPGTLWTPSVGNPPRTDQRIRIERRNVQEPAGGLSGSLISVSIRRTIAPVIAE